MEVVKRCSCLPMGLSLSFSHTHTLSHTNTHTNSSYMTLIMVHEMHGWVHPANFFLGPLSTWTFHRPVGQRSKVGVFNPFVTTPGKKIVNDCHVATSKTQQRLTLLYYVFYGLNLKSYALMTWCFLAWSCCLDLVNLPPHRRSASKSISWQSKESFWLLDVYPSTNWARQSMESDWVGETWTSRILNWVHKTRSRAALVVAVSSNRWQFSCLELSRKG